MCRITEPEGSSVLLMLSGIAESGGTKEWNMSCERAESDGPVGNTVLLVLCGMVVLYGSAKCGVVIKVHC